MKIDNAKEAGCELDEMEAHRFLEKVSLKEEKEEKDSFEIEKVDFDKTTHKFRLTLPSLCWK